MTMMMISRKEGGGMGWYGEMLSVGEELLMVIPRSLSSLLVLSTRWRVGTTVVVRGGTGWPSARAPSSSNRGYGTHTHARQNHDRNLVMVMVLVVSFVVSIVIVMVLIIIVFKLLASSSSDHHHPI
jgi:hypothetical protein